MAARHGQQQVLSRYFFHRAKAPTASKQTTEALRGRDGAKRPALSSHAPKPAKRAKGGDGDVVVISSDEGDDGAPLENATAAEGPDGVDAERFSHFESDPKRRASLLAALDRAGRASFEAGGAGEGREKKVGMGEEEEQEEEQEEEEEGGDDGDDAETQRPAAAASACSARRRAPPRRRGQKDGGEGEAKYTPLERQVMAIQEKHPDVILFVEVGYKYRFFGRDAEVVAKLLDIYCHRDRNFMTASIPTHRLRVHLQRVVGAGYKAGVVRQTEQAATKRSQGGSGPFARELREIYTQATFIPEANAFDRSEVRAAVAAPRYLLLLFEESVVTLEAATATALADAKRVRVHLMAADPSSGDVVWDSFEDDVLRGELESRLSFVHPTEILVPGDATLLSAQSLRVLEDYASRGGAGGDDDRLRIERLDPRRFLFHYGSARNAITSFYSAASAAAGARQLQEAVALPRGPATCLGVLLEYLRDFGLERVLLYATSFRHCSALAQMRIDAAAARNLELLQNQDDGGFAGSLLWLLSRTRSAFGGRALRKWVSQPLVDQGRINARLDAVEALVRGRGSAWLDRLMRVLHGLPDLERALARIQYRKCTPAELLATLGAFQRVARELPSAVELAAEDVRSALLQEAVACVQGRALAETCAARLAELDPDAAQRGDLVALFRQSDLFPSLEARKQAVRDVEARMRQHLVEARRTLGPGYQSLEFKTVLMNEYLVEVAVQHKARVPASWVQINSTKKAVRYHPPDVARSYQDLQVARERLDLEAQLCWQRHVDALGAHYELLRGAVSGLATLDALTALAEVSSQPGYTRPEVVDRRCLVVRGGRHPMVEAVTRTPYVANDIELKEEGAHCMVITGPNMGGKSSYIRQMALIVIMAQTGCFVPADAATLGVFDAVFTRMGARDSISERLSTFLVELSETATILRRATPRSLVILDELGRGTSTHDGTAIAFATLEHIVREVRCFTLFVTHYPQLAALEARFPALVGNFRMSYAVEPLGSTLPVPSSSSSSSSSSPPSSSPGSAGPSLVFLYKLVRGVSDRSFGINVARLADLPASVLRRATEKADELRDAVEARAGPLAAQAAAWERLAALCTDVLANSALASDAALAERVRDAQRAACDALPSE